MRVSEKRMKEEWLDHKNLPEVPWQLAGDREGAVQLEGISLPFPDAPETGAPQTLTSGRLYSLINLRWTLADEWTLSGFTLWNLEDQTGIAFPYLTWLGGQRVSANIGLQTSMGTDGEFRPNPADLTIQGVDLTALSPQRTALAWVRVSL